MNSRAPWEEVELFGNTNVLDFCRARQSFFGRWEEEEGGSVMDSQDIPPITTACNVKCQDH